MGISKSIRKGKNGVEPVFIQCGRVSIFRAEMCKQRIKIYFVWRWPHVCWHKHSFSNWSGPFTKKRQHSGNVSLEWLENITFTVCWNYFERERDAQKNTKKNSAQNYKFEKKKSSLVRIKSYLSFLRMCFFLSLCLPEDAMKHNASKGTSEN